MGGFVGGAFYMVYSRPVNVWDAALRSSVSTAIAIIGAVPVLNWLDITPSVSLVIMSASVLGFMSWSVCSLLARTLVDAEKGEVSLKLPFVEKKRKKRDIYDERDQEDQFTT